MSKKVGIVSCYFKKNYGSMLQAYATQKILDNNNIPNETINIEENVDFKKGKRKYYISQIFNFGFIKSKFGMIKLKFDKSINRELKKNIGIRSAKYNEFKREFRISRKCNSYSDLTKLAKEKYNNIIVGSDQLWLPVNVVSDYYTLNWVPNEINKISYATSFGFSKVPNKYYDTYSSFLKRINHISTREESGVKIIKSIIGKDAELVADPTLLLTKEEWEKESSKGRIINEKYILCYFLGSNIEHRKFAERLRDETGCKIVSLNHADEYVKYSDMFCDYALYDVGPREWINLVKNAEYVCTDSFHGTVFAITFNKIFFDFRRYNVKSKVSTNSRIDSLLHVAGINSERILTGKEDVKKVLEYRIDYNKVNERIDTFRQNSKKWLLDSIKFEKDENKCIKISDKEECCGCTACMSICPVDAIEMVADNEGFLYPKVDKKKCIDCGKCKKACPIINKQVFSSFEPKAYLFQNKNEQIRNDSTSGGFYSAIGNYVIEQNGVVYGAAFNTEWKVVHQRATQKNELSKFRKSKYVQSDLKDIFRSVKNDLESNILVLFSGTPCQVAGLNSFLGKKYDNLIMVDIMCHSVPSPKFFEKYKKHILNKLNADKISDINFRDKSKYGYKYSMMTIKTNNGTYSQGIDTDPYLRAFFSDYSVRPSCYRCSFKTMKRVSDFTIWDCFNINEIEKSFDDDKGTTRVLIQSIKGEKIFDKLFDVRTKELELKRAVYKVKEMSNSVNYNSNRQKFFEKIDDDNLFDEFFPINLKTRINSLVRKLLSITGMYTAIKSIAKKVLRK